MNSCDGLPSASPENSPPLAFARVKILCCGNSCLNGRFPKGFQDVPLGAQIVDIKFAVNAMSLAWPTDLSFRTLEIGQYIAPSPSNISLLPPVVVIKRMPADIDHAVDGGRTA